MPVRLGGNQWTEYWVGEKRRGEVPETQLAPRIPTMAAMEVEDGVAIMTIPDCNYLNTIEQYLGQDFLVEMLM
jgi:hypothetical protein